MPHTSGRKLVFAWGAGEDGQLGLEEAPIGEDDWSISIPTVVTALQGLSFDGHLDPQTLLAGSRHSLALDSSGALYTWGWNQKATLGLGHQGVVKVPTPVQALADKEIKQGCWGGWHGLAVTKEGDLYAWGGNENYQCLASEDESEKMYLLPRPVMSHIRTRQVAAGAMHSLVLTEGGEMWTWGQPLTTWMTTSDMNTYSKARVPQRIEGASGIVAIAAGAFHNLALTSTGRVLAWGHSDYGQLGLGSTTHFATPNTVDELDRSGVVALSAGGWHSAALTAGGIVYIWGRGEYGRLGLGDNWKDRLRPTELPLSERIVQIECGGTHSLARTVNGNLLSFGRPTLGRLGRSSATNPNIPLPVEFPPPGEGLRWSVEAVAAGGRHTLALARAVPVGASNDEPAPRWPGDDAGRLRVQIPKSVSDQPPPSPQPSPAAPAAASAEPSTANPT